MDSISTSRWVFWGVVIILGVAVMAPPQELPAQSTDCVAVDQNDQPRACTFLEEHQIDLLACNLATPLTLLKTILR